MCWFRLVRTRDKSTVVKAKTEQIANPPPWPASIATPTPTPVASPIGDLRGPSTVRTEAREDRGPRLALDCDETVYDGGWPRWA